MAIQQRASPLLKLISTIALRYLPDLHLRHGGFAAAVVCAVFALPLLVCGVAEADHGSDAVEQDIYRAVDGVSKTLPDLESASTARVVGSMEVLYYGSECLNAMNAFLPGTVNTPEQVKLRISDTMAKLFAIVKDRKAPNGDERHLLFRAHILRLLWNGTRDAEGPTTVDRMHGLSPGNGFVLMCKAELAWLDGGFDSAVVDATSAVMAGSVDLGDRGHLSRMASALDELGLLDESMKRTLTALGVDKRAMDILLRHACLLRSLSVVAQYAKPEHHPRAEWADAYVGQSLLTRAPSARSSSLALCMILAKDRGIGSEGLGWAESDPSWGQLLGQMWHFERLFAAKKLELRNSGTVTEIDRFLRSPHDWGRESLGEESQRFGHTVRHWQDFLPRLRE